MGDAPAPVYSAMREELRGLLGRISPIVAADLVDMVCGSESLDDLPAEKFERLRDLTLEYLARLHAKPASY